MVGGPHLDACMPDLGKVRLMHMVPHMPRPMSDDYKSQEVCGGINGHLQLLEMAPVFFFGHIVISPRKYCNLIDHTVMGVDQHLINYYYYCYIL
jgi:hypothetical protein